MQVITKFGIWSCGRLGAALFAFLGLCIGIFLALSLELMKQFLRVENISLEIAWILGVIAIPLMFMIGGFFIGMILAIGYNLLSHVVGGLRFYAIERMS